MRHRFTAPFFAVLVLALAVFAGSALAGDGHGKGSGDTGKTAKPAKQDKQSSTSATNPATGGDNSQGVKPSNTTKHDTYAKASSDQTKKYGNGQTAGQIATKSGHGDATLHGPGNSQPHKTAACPGGHEVDVHALKHKDSKCSTSQDTKAAKVDVEQAKVDEEKAESPDVEASEHHAKKVDVDQAKVDEEKAESADVEASEHHAKKVDVEQAKVDEEKAESADVEASEHDVKKVDVDQAKVDEEKAESADVEKSEHDVTVITVSPAAPAALTPAVATPATVAPATTAAGAVQGTQATITPAASSPAATPAPSGGVKGAVVALKPTKTKPAGGVLGATTLLGGKVASTTLPFTGLPLWIFALVAAALIGIGFTVRRASANRI